MEPSLTTVKRLFALSRNRCAFPECGLPIVEETGTVTGLICHMKAKNRGGPRYDPNQTEAQRHAFENLILMCARHSKLIDSEPERFTVDVLHNMKKMHERKGVTLLSLADAGKVEQLLKEYRTIHISAGGHVMLNSPGAVQANKVVFKSQRQSLRMIPPAGSLASDLSRRNYIKYLIDRYHKFASEQTGREFKYQVVYAAIKSRYRAKWDYVSLNLFDDLALFLQGRIDKTILGKINRAKGIPNYLTYAEFCRKQEVEF